MQYGTKVRWICGLAASGMMLVSTTGCRHKPVLLPLPQITQPMALLDIPDPETVRTEMIEAPPARLPAVPYAAAGGTIRRERKRRTQPAVTAATPIPNTTAPTTSEPATSPDVATIGALTTGGDASPHAQQEAAGLIASNDRRINGLRAQVVEAEKAQLNQVRNFQKQAQDALSTGDTEGAKTLATKAKLLLDDIEKL